jgi:soluble lytic murein transglycosylase
VTRAAARPRAPARRRQRARRGWRMLAIVFVALVAAGAAIFAADARRAVNAVVLPLNHEDIIRQQAREKNLDPFLIAGVIYAESHFREGRTSAAGAQGLMQITPATAADIARKSGGIAFETKDLHTAQVNIAYGSFYLRYLLDRYDGNQTLAIAAYNAGYGNVDRWVANSSSQGRGFSIGEIPFSETRAYVSKVLKARADYRDSYSKQLSIAP